MPAKDIGAFADAMRRDPEGFFIRDGYLHRRGSPVRYALHFGGLMVVELGADEVRRLLSRGDADLLASAFVQWHQEYWIPTQVAKAFARQFRQPRLWRRIWHRIERHLPAREAEGALATYARAFAADRPEHPEGGGREPPRGATWPRRPPPGGDSAATPRQVQLAD
jgi:hypothetical protein